MEPKNPDHREKPAAGAARTDPPRDTPPSNAAARGAEPAAHTRPRWVARSRGRILLVGLLLFALLGGLIWFLSARYWTTPVTPIRQPAAPESLPPPTPSPVATAATASPAGAVTPLPSSTPPPAPSPADASPSGQGAPSPSPQAQNSPQAGAGSAAPGTLLIPVAGIRPGDLRDTYTEARSEGRTHNAIDIIAPCGTPVVAAADGKVVKLFNSRQGGVTFYQIAPDERTVYYYAHLQRYADGLAEGRVAHRGDTVAYVGDTGNATPGNCHLHFEVSLVEDPRRWSGGTPLNPYPLLAGTK